MLFSLAGYMKDEEVLNGTIYPSISRFVAYLPHSCKTPLPVLMRDNCSIRDITKEVAAAVVREAVAEDLAEGYRDMEPKELQKLTQVNKLWNCFVHFLFQKVQACLPLFLLL